MKIQFEDKLDFQLDAIEAVCELFRGQDICRSEFTVVQPSSGPQAPLAYAESTLGVGNRLILDQEDVLENLRAVQLSRGLAQDAELLSNDFTVEMETGTGKTYVYLRTVHELHRRYGFTKFIIVVPSVAIKEGVAKTLQMTEEHFLGLYNTKAGYFLYDSSELGQVRSFATSPSLQVMVVTVGAINKKEVNNLYKVTEDLGDQKAIDLLQEIRPIVIVDEPQSVDGGVSGSGKRALEAMKPLCTLRYSATHVVKYHMVYKLDAVDAYQRKLVKQINVASATTTSANNRPYLRLLGITSTRGRPIQARIEVDVQRGASVVRMEVPVEHGDDLQQVTRRAVYADHRIGDLTAMRDRQQLLLHAPGNDVTLAPGEMYGGIDPDAVHREMIRRTIKEHLEKELRLRPLGIKVLSLFFIDRVDRYRRYAADGQMLKGRLADIFEQEYQLLARAEVYRDLFGSVDLRSEAAQVHDGYFSVDSGKRWTDTLESNQTGRDAAQYAYNLIMKEKEKLLSLATPLKFIFSHSALKEGWDNPNVFQICTLREVGSERERRQTIGRGLRICVNQSGERVRDSDVGRPVNVLTVVATESYEQFAEALQVEIEKDTGIRFGVVEAHLFANVPVLAVDGTVSPVGAVRSKALWEWLKTEGYVDARGNVQDKLKMALKQNTFTLPASFADLQVPVEALLRKVAGKLEIKDADEKPERVRSRRTVLDSPEFRILWDRIKLKTTYRVDFDNPKLVADCAAVIERELRVAKARISWTTANIDIDRGGVHARDAKEVDAGRTLQEGVFDLPDLLTELQNRTPLTRRSITTILTGSGRLDDFARNPQDFIKQVSAHINHVCRAAIVDGIKYQKIGDQEYYAQELFETEELYGYLKSNMIPATKSPYEYVVYDSDSVEKTFCAGLEANEAVKVYTKLPAWFKIPTPLGSYNPDWAVLVERDGEEKLFFVVETKHSLFGQDLRGTENMKIACGEAHFEVLTVRDSVVHYMTARSMEDFADQWE